MQYFPCYLFQALANGFFNFDTFDVDEYEHYEVGFYDCFANFLQFSQQACLKSTYSKTCHKQTEGLRVRASPASLQCVLEQDTCTLIIA